MRSERKESATAVLTYSFSDIKFHKARGRNPTDNAVIFSIRKFIRERR